MLEVWTAARLDKGEFARPGEAGALAMNLTGLATESVTNPSQRTAPLQCWHVDAVDLMSYHKQEQHCG